MNDVITWKSAVVGSALMAALSATPVAAIILAIGIGLALIIAAALFGSERAFRGYAEVIRAKSGRK